MKEVFFASPLTDHTCHNRKLKLLEIDSPFIKTHNRHKNEGF